MDVVKESDIKAQINGVAAEMKEFDFFFLLFRLLLSENHTTHITLAKQFKQQQCLQLRVIDLSQLCNEVLKKLQTDECLSLIPFGLMWSRFEKL